MIEPPGCIRQGHENEEVVKGHIISKSTQRLFANSKSQVRAFQTHYQPGGKAQLYIPEAHAPLSSITSAATIPGTCSLCEPHFDNIDHASDVNQQIDLTRALHEACARNTHHAIWLVRVFNKRLEKLFSDKNVNTIKSIEAIDKIDDIIQVNDLIETMSLKFLPDQPPDPVKPSVPLKYDDHFHHFVMLYPAAPFRVAISTEVVLLHENDLATATLGYVNAVPQKTQGAQDWYTAASLSIPREADPLWEAILNNSRHFNNLQHRLMISNLATKSPDGICFAPDHFKTLPWNKYIKPNLLENPLPGLRLPVVNITGNDLSDLTTPGFNIFATTQPQNTP